MDEQEQALRDRAAERYYAARQEWREIMAGLARVEAERVALERRRFAALARLCEEEAA